MEAGAGPRVVAKEKPFVLKLHRSEHPHLPLQRLVGVRKGDPREGVRVRARQRVKVRGGLAQGEGEGLRLPRRHVAHAIAAGVHKLKPHAEVVRGAVAKGVCKGPQGGRLGRAAGAREAEDGGRGRKAHRLDRRGAQVLEHRALAAAIQAGGEAARGRAVEEHGGVHKGGHLRAQDGQHRAQLQQREGEAADAQRARLRIRARHAPPNRRGVEHGQRPRFGGKGRAGHGRAGHKKGEPFHRDGGRGGVEGSGAAQRRQAQRRRRWQPTAKAQRRAAHAPRGVAK